MLRTLIMLSDQLEHGKNNRIKCLLCSTSNQLLTFSVQKNWISFSFPRKNHSHANKRNVTNKAAFLQCFSSSLELTAIQNMRLPSNHQSSPDMDETFMQIYIYGNANRDQGKWEIFNYVPKIFAATLYRNTSILLIIHSVFYFYIFQQYMFYKK